MRATHFSFRFSFKFLFNFFFMKTHFLNGCKSKFCSPVANQKVDQLEPKNDGARQHSTPSPHMFFAPPRTSRTFFFCRIFVIVTARPKRR